MFIQYGKTNSSRTQSRRNNERDCIIVLTDANGRLQRDAESVGHYCVHPRGDENGKLLHNLMTEKNLSAASTYFKPKKGKGKLGNATYVMAKTEDSKQPPAQIDYILVSKRWMSSVLNCKVEWSRQHLCFS